MSLTCRMQDVCDPKKRIATLPYLSRTMHLGNMGKVEKIFESSDPIASTLLFVGISQYEASIWSFWQR